MTPTTHDKDRIEEARRLLQDIDSLPQEEKTAVLEDPEIASAYRFAQSLVAQQAATESRGNIFSSVLPSALSGALGGFLGGGPAGAALGAGLGFLLPHEKPPTEAPGGYLLDIFLPRAASRLDPFVSRLLGTTSEGLSSPGLFGRTILKETMTTGPMLAGAGAIDAALSDDSSRSPLAAAGHGLLFSAGFGLLKGTPRLFMPKTQAEYASRIREAAGESTLPELRQKTLAQEMLEEGPEHPISQAYSLIRASVEDHQNAILKKETEISALRARIAGQQNRLARAVGNDRVRVAQETAEMKAELRKKLEEQTRLKIDYIVEQFGLQREMEKIRLGLRPYDPAKIPSGKSVSLEEAVDMARSGKLPLPMLADILTAVERGEVSVRLPSGEYITIVRGSFDNIENIVDPAELESLRRQAETLAHAGKLEPKKARAIAVRIENQFRRLVDDEARAMSLNQFAERLENVEYAENRLLEKRIEMIENELQKKLTSEQARDPATLAEIERLRLLLTNTRAQLARKQHALRQLKAAGPEMLRDAPELYAIVEKSSGVNDFVEKLIDKDTPDDVIPKTLAVLRRNDPELAEEFRDRLTTEIFRRHFDSVRSGKRIPLQVGKLFQIYRDKIPQDKAQEVFSLLREFAELADEYVYGGGVMPYIQYGFRWVVRSLPTYLLLGATSLLAPRLAALGAIGLALSMPMLTEQIAMNSKVGYQLIRWLRDDAASPHRLVAYPALKRFILDNAVPITQYNMNDFLGETAVSPRETTGTPAESPLFGPAVPPALPAERP